MQKYWLPFRNLENLNKNTKDQSMIVEPIRKQILNSKNDFIEAPTTKNVQFAKSVTVRNVFIDKPQTTSRSSENVIQEQINRGEQNQHGFTTALTYANSINDRKRLTTLPEESEPARKKFQSNNGSMIDSTRNESTKSVNAQSEAAVRQSENVVRPQVRSENKLFVNKRCLTGDVNQIFIFNKKFPSSDAVYEIYANVMKVDKTKVGQKNVLLRSNTGPVVKGIFFEVDIKMIEVEVGDAVRCVGKIMGNSWLHIFKISKMEYNKQLVPRLFSLANFAISNLKNSNDK